MQSRPDGLDPAQPRAAAPERSALVRAEQVRAQYRIIPGAVIGSALVATVVAGMMGDRMGLRMVLPWLACCYLLLLTRLALWRAFRADQPAVAALPRWERLAIVMGATSGVVWGLGGILLHDSSSLSHQLFVLVAIAGMGFTSTYVTAPLLPAFLVEIGPSLVLAAMPFLVDGSESNLAIGIGTLLLLPVFIRMATQVSRTFSDTVNMRLHNQQLMAELLQQKDAAEAANVAKSRFLAVASHDLRQPLHALGLFVEALQESSVAAHERQLVNNIRRSVDAMEEQFDALLDISRLDAGIIRPRFETFSLAALFERLTSELSPLAGRKGLTLRVVRTNAIVCSDLKLLERIVRNLVSNAINYTDAGGVLLGCRRDAGGLRIEVWDTGRGIPAEQQWDIFREFSQLQNVEPGTRTGLGLGLAIVERLARLLDHGLALRSVMNRGTVFSVSVPRGREEDLTLYATVERTTAFDLGGASILVMDSEPVVLQAMEALLNKWNGEVVTAATGAEMMQKLPLLHSVPSVIISDYRTAAAPGAGTALSDIEMLRAEFNTEIPAVLLTGDTAAEQSLAERRPANLSILQKPVNPARLRTLLSNILRVDQREQPRRAG